MQLELTYLYDRDSLGVVRLNEARVFESFEELGGSLHYVGLVGESIRPYSLGSVFETPGVICKRPQGDEEETRLER